MTKPWILAAAAVAILAVGPESARAGLLAAAVPLATPCADSLWAERHAQEAALALGASPAANKDWILRAADNICGLKDANQLTHPAQIDFETCLQATPEMKRVRDQGIDPKSAEGIQLRSAAVSRVTTACEAVRAAQGHCSVWKSIRHKDGRAIPDLSSQVIARF